MSTQQELTPERVLSEVGYTDFVKSLFNRTGDASKDFAHAILGIVTEIHELRCATDAVNVLEEKGDLFFYCVALGIVVESVIQVELSDEQLESVNQFVDEIEENIAVNYDGDSEEFIADATTSLLDHAKRWVGYGKQPEDLIETTREALGLVTWLLDYDHTEEQVMLANIAKLLERYKGLTFSADRAVNRDTAAERSVLEQHAA